ncbi:MAG: T9SS type A sorting domain-containing protein [Candidatus Krumholzibacteria bacterium]|nr:T9SS type A sorting domain-containing protein [Candidatus Krumholzibacteria bacterium]
MRTISGASIVLALAALLLILTTALPGGAPGYANNTTMMKETSFTLTLYGFPPEPITLFGTETVTWTDPYTGGDAHVYIDCEIVDMEISDMAMTIRNNPDLAGMGITRSVDEWIDFPAESFFDILYEIEIPGIFPGDTLFTHEPMHIHGIVDRWPPYGHTYVMANPAIVVYTGMGIPVGEITGWSEVKLPWEEPRAGLTVDTEYGSDVAEEIDDDVVEARACINAANSYVIAAQFLCRESGTGPFLPFWVDTDGSGGNYGTSAPKESGDGWAGYLDISTFSTLGGHYDIMVDFDVIGIGHVMDTVTIYIDPTPPIPVFNTVIPDSVIYFHADSLFEITFTMEDEIGGVGSSEMRIYPLAPDYSRTLVPINQNNLDNRFDGLETCVPTATASCLKWFADNGYGNLDHPGGNEEEEELTGEEMAEELVGDMGTDSSGTTPDKAIDGIKKYLKNHGENADDWDVDHEEVENYEDIGEMLREFEADSEDVIILLADTNAAGDTVGHAGTLGSKNSEYYEQHIGEDTVGKIGYTLDFMDPNGGVPAEENEWGVDENDAGLPTLQGYSCDLDSTEGCAWIEGYIKVSPPEGGGAGSPGTAPRATHGRGFDLAPSSPGWIQVSMGTVAGSGAEDTLRWDTTGFPGGLYLIEIVTVDDEGIQCRDLRLGGIPQYTVTGDPETPGAETTLRGSYPNPFNPSTTIEFSLASGTAVSMSIYDVSGRRVRCLLRNEPREKGLHTVQWDGRNDRGVQMPSGVYFCRFEAGREHFSRKMIILR